MSDQESDTILEEILKANEGRKRPLLRIKYEEMATGVFSFYRATNHLYARGWSSVRPIDPGPLILLCGDLHLENFGAYLTEAGDCRFAINDFDEAFVAPAAVDLVRCAASIFLAEDEWRVTTSTAAAMVVEFLDRYRSEVVVSAHTGKTGEIDPSSSRGALLELLTPTALGSRQAMLAETTVTPKGGKHPLIRRDPKKRSIRPKTIEKIREGFDGLIGLAGLVRPFEILDATTRIAGLGSLGLRRYLTLVRGGHESDGVRLIDVKEAARPALAGFIDAPQPSWGDGEAMRSVQAERLVLEKPESGLAAIVVGGRSCRVRELIPEANRSKLSRLRRDPAKLREAVRAAGGIAAWAHIRGAGAVGPNQADALAGWASGPSFDAIMVSAARAADRCHAEYDQYCQSIARKSVRKRLGLAPEITVKARD